MQRDIPVVFVLCVFFSLLIFFFSSTQTIGGLGILGNALLPVQSGIYHALTAPQNIGKKKSQQQIDTTLNQASQQGDYQRLKEDNAALRDQFATPQTAQLLLVPSHIIGAPQFLPGITKPDYLVIDIGSSSGIKKGQAVVYKNNLLGTIQALTPVSSQVRLVSSTGISISAKTNGTNALGVLKGMGSSDMMLGNVVLSDQLQVGDLIVANLSQNLDSTGYPPGLIIGKITSVEKNPSNLFQQARVQSLVDVTEIPMVFVVKGTK